MRPDPRTHGCATCRHGESEALEQVGKPKRFDFMGGKAREDHTRYKCQECGAEWVRLVEGGAGGHGSFWHPYPIEGYEGY